MMNRRDFIKSASLVTMGNWTMLNRLVAASAEKKPNIVLIFTDDQGYFDASCYPHQEDVKTPHIDRLAKDGIRLTDGYSSAPVCAPSRAGLLTGRYQQRFGIYSNTAAHGIPTEEILLPQLLKQANYTSACIGKWHLGDEAEFHPLKRGFDEFYGFLPGMHDYYDAQIPERPIFRNYEIVSQKEITYLTHDFTREAVSFIERHKNKPFFLYLAYNAVHTKIVPPPGFNGDPDDIRKVYTAMLTALDEGVGKVRDALKKTGVDKNTLIFFVSDNGGSAFSMRYHPKDVSLKQHKSYTAEGGIRVPFIVSWPGHLPTDKTCSDPVITLDILPTVLAAVGLTVPTDREFDGRNLLPVLNGKSDGPLHDALYWHYPGKNTGETWAIRKGDWKLHFHERMNGNNSPKSKGKGQLELFNLANDISETKNLAGENPDLVAELYQDWCEWRKQMAPAWSPKKKVDKYLRQIITGEEDISWYDSPRPDSYSKGKAHSDKKQKNIQKVKENKVKQEKIK